MPIVAHRWQIWWRGWIQYAEGRYNSDLIPAGLRSRYTELTESFPLAVLTVPQLPWRGFTDTCQVGNEGIYKKGIPVPAANRNRSWRGAFQRPARLPGRLLPMTPAHRSWTGVSRYMASDASNSTTANTISRATIKHLMAELLFRLAPRQAQAFQ